MISNGIYAPEFLSGICLNMKISESRENAHEILKIRKKPLATKFAVFLVDHTKESKNVPTIEMNKATVIIGLFYLHN